MQKSSTTLQIIFILIFLFGTNQISFSQVLEQDSLALVALYNSTDGANWIDKTNWLTGPVSTWFDITVTGDRVTEVKLRWNNLVGTIPSEIGNLTELTSLSLIQNSLSGSIPAEIGNLSKLTKLALTSNQLTGTIPAEIGNLTNLQFLGLELNNLSGSIPPEIGNLTNLTYLTLNQNDLSGNIPVELFNLTHLQNVFLNMNKFSGHIPPQIGNLTELEYVSLYGNNLEGPLPSEIQNLTKLIVFYVSKNNFTGAIPSWIGNLTNLTELSLAINQFSGHIPPEMGNLTNLIQLHLNDNQLTGAVPTEFSNLVKVQNLWLSENQLLDLPDLSTDTSLVSLTIYRNQFTFEDIEPNVGISGIEYSPQARLGEDKDSTISAGASITLTVTTGGTANHYQWIKDGDEIPGAQNSSYEIISADSSHTGTYICKITNTIVAGLTLYSSPFHLTISSSVDVKDNDTKMPLEFSLSQNYPNPFNPVTIIEYAIPSNEFVVLKVFDALGREVGSLVNEEKSAGAYKVEFDGGELASGIYYYTLMAGEYSAAKKLLLMK